MQGSLVCETRKSSNEHIASMSVTKDKEKMSIYSGAQQPQSRKEITSTGRTAAASAREDEIVTIPPPL